MFFRQRKPKTFNYKPIYFKPQEDEGKGIKKEMLETWNRPSYQNTLQEGQKKIKRWIMLGAVLAFSIYWLINYLGTI